MPRTLSSDRIHDLEHSAQGLNDAEVSQRQARYGRNLIAERHQGSWRALIMDTLKDPMLWFLLVTSILFAFTQQYTEAVILLMALIPFLGMDAYLHRRTQASTESLGRRLASQARVLRNGKEQSLNTIELVPGDIVLLAPGDTIPADGVFVSVQAFQVDESTLTGEAFPIRKQALETSLQLQPSARIAEQHWGFAGTNTLTGSARMMVTRTGKTTVYGEIIQSVIHGSHTLTPLQQAVSRLVKRLLIIASIICVLLAITRLYQGHDIIDALLSGLTLAVAALPEEFPVVLTFFLGVGVYRLAQRQALVKRAVVVENIGRVSCICTDKTGTLTEGRLQLTHQLTATGVDGQRLLTIAAYASRPDTGDPMDQAILAIATAVPHTILNTFPFTEDRKRETAVVLESQQHLVAVKGAPETILAQCQLADDELHYWQQQVDQLASAGHKVIACAWRELDAATEFDVEPEQQFRIAGLLAFEDPLREGVRSAVDTCQRAGIRVIMVTGDHPITATAIAKEIGLHQGYPRVMEGETLATQLAQGDTTALDAVDVIARAIPAQKLALVRSLKQRGEIVAVTGDGINDVPAIQSADIGIAMGARGTRSAHEAAAIILLDDNFRSIVQAIAEGRQLFSNLRLSFEYLLLIHIPLVVTAALIPFLDYPMLYLPIHIVWLEMLIHPTALLVFQNSAVTADLRQTRPDAPAQFFSWRQWLLIVISGMLVTLLITFAYIRSFGVLQDVAHARAMALVVLTSASTGITIALSRLRTVTAKVIVLLNMLSSVLLIQLPPLAALLHLSPLHLDDWLIALAGGLMAALLPFIKELKTPS
ncbi:cation-transporting P-type ATPase [Shewanella yunxiaonensis]|uniref:Cation-transporting P-type ATPase n=1 Tax=Shewanella yunxiaonensis TaxID=2829809 RepID=A0ABX7YSC9_9GAMM|nr:cation-transporting P-type ATPase [Shewanella yunxiaonensis]QUN05285.1 cation-transporting P-type ATPase [Shewanella yunxiaonensis]